MCLTAQGRTATTMIRELGKDAHTIGRWATAFGEESAKALVFGQSGASLGLV